MSLGRALTMDQALDRTVTLRVTRVLNQVVTVAAIQVQNQARGQTQTPMIAVAAKRRRTRRRAK